MGQGVVVVAMTVDGGCGGGVGDEGGVEWVQVVRCLCMVVGGFVGGVCRGWWWLEVACGVYGMVVCARRARVPVVPGALAVPAEPAAPGMQRVPAGPRQQFHQLQYFLEFLSLLFLSLLPKLPSLL